LLGVTFVSVTVITRDMHAFLDWLHAFWVAEIPPFSSLFWKPCLTYFYLPRLASLHLTKFLQKQKDAVVLDTVYITSSRSQCVNLVCRVKGCDSIDNFLLSLFIDYAVW